MMWYFPGMGWWMVVAGIAIVSFLVALVALGVWAVRQLTRRDIRGTGPPLEIAKARYARGDISSEEFERIKRDLDSG